MVIGTYYPNITHFFILSLVLIPQKFWFEFNFFNTVFLRVEKQRKWRIKDFLTSINHIQHKVSLLLVIYRAYYNSRWGGSGLYVFMSHTQSESTLYIFLNVKELLARSRRKMWSLSANWTRTHCNCYWIRTHSDWYVVVHKWALNHHLAKLSLFYPSCSQTCTLPSKSHPIPLPQFSKKSINVPFFV